MAKTVRTEKTVFDAKTLEISSKVLLEEIGLQKRGFYNELMGHFGEWPNVYTDNETANAALRSIAEAGEKVKVASLCAAMKS